MSLNFTKPFPIKGVQIQIMGLRCESLDEIGLAQGKEAKKSKKIEKK
jgi:hypothetical protein